MGPGLPARLVISSTIGGIAIDCRSRSWALCGIPLKANSSPIRSVALVHGLGDVVVATVSYRVRLAPKGNTAQAAHSRDHSSKIARAHVFSISFWPIQDQERPFAFVANPRDSIGDVDACTYIHHHAYA